MQTSLCAGLPKSCLTDAKKHSRALPLSGYAALNSEQSLGQHVNIVTRFFSPAESGALAAPIFVTPLALGLWAQGLVLA